MKIPVVDLGELNITNQNAVSGKEIERLAKELDDAFARIGFVYLKNHGIPKELVGALFHTALDFFSLPAEKKLAYSRKLGSNGYVHPGREILEGKNRTEIRESYDITATDGNFPDEEVPNFRLTIKEFYPQLLGLTNRILHVLAHSLGLENKEFFVKNHIKMGENGNSTTLRCLYYPPLLGDEIQPGVERCGAHSDYGTVSLLFQDEMGGLEVMSEKQWVPADPIPGTILVNVGDLLQFWSSDRYPATMHRVRIPEEEIRRKTNRQSFAFFVHPEDEITVKPLDGSDKYSAIGALEHLQNRFASTYKY